MTSSVIPRDDAGRLAFLQHLNATLRIYVASVGIGADDLARLNSATLWFKYALDFQAATKTTDGAVAAFKNAVRDRADKPVIPQFPNLTPPEGEPFDDVFGFVSHVAM